MWFQIHIPVSDVIWYIIQVAKFFTSHPGASNSIHGGFIWNSLLTKLYWRRLCFEFLWVSAANHCVPPHFPVLICHHLLGCMISLEFISDQAFGRFKEVYFAERWHTVAYFVTEFKLIPWRHWHNGTRLHSLVYNYSVNAQVAYYGLWRFIVIFIKYFLSRNT